jgi:hypothetical protein
MCDQCAEIDRYIETYRRIAKQADDEGTIYAIKKLVGLFEERKRALHPEKHWH